MIPRSHSGGREPGAKVLLPAGSGAYRPTDLYVAVRRIGGAEAPLRVHMVYSAPGVSIIRRRLCRSKAVWR